MLAAVFRRVSEVALVVGAMAFSGLVLCGLMAAAALALRRRRVTTA